MALLYSAKTSPKSTALKTLSAPISALDYQGLGVAKVNGKVWFIENALPGESVQAQVLDEKRQYGLAVARKWQGKSADRVTPKCEYFARCGGCQTQHIVLNAIQSAKQTALFERLQKLQNEPIALMPKIVGEPFHYRRRVRLSANWNAKTKQLDVGFRAKNSSQIVPIERCLVADLAINETLEKLTALLPKLPEPKSLGHIELVSADNGVAMLVRLQNAGKFSRPYWQDFAAQNGINLQLVTENNSEFLGEPPFYTLGELKLQFDIRDFIQVNRALNQQMVQTALDWLDLRESDRVLDLFCGMGNFTLPIAQRAAQVVGVEGVGEMVQKARLNAKLNGINNAEFQQTDLAQSFIDKTWAQQAFDKMLLDPPRAGADFALNALCELNIPRVVYVSCNPATLVRDAQILRAHGYRIVQTAMIDMFPHTAHLESITLLVK